VARWLCCSRLCLNVLKSNSLLIGSRQRVANKTLNVSVGGKLLTQVSFVCYLGVTIDPSLSWNLHISNVVSRVRSQIASLFCFGSLSPVVFCMLYTASLMTTVMLFGPLQLQSLQVYWKEYIPSLLKKTYTILCS